MRRPDSTADNIVRFRSSGVPRLHVAAVSISLGAIALFVFTGGTLLTTNLNYLMGIGPAAAPGLLVAFLLNVALVLFTWRRSAELEKQVSAREAAEQEAFDLANKDQMTGLFNRRSLITAAEQHLAGSHSKAAVLVMDLDHFKKVNDLHGHATGDALLQKVAAILMEELPPGACCARLGGDEFAMLVTGDHAAREAAERIGAAIVGRLGEPLDVQGKLANISCSLGIAKTSSSSATIADLLRHADIAMYEAKRQGRNRFVWFTEAMAEELNQRNQLEAEMRAGIGRGEFVPYFQPQIQLDTGAVHGFEVLARWQHPERGIIEPNEFIGIAEATGLIANLSLAVMRTALESAKSWDHDLTIAINISPVQLKDPLLGQKVTKLLTETGFPAQRLELEITESSLFDDLDMALTTVESLKNLGIKISLDDFGTGYSSLTQLQSLPFDRIKIDRSFVISMKDNVESAAIVKAIVQLGASLQMPVTAEGVETLNIQNALQKLGCSEGQGWLFGKPISLEVLEASFGRPATRAPRAVGTASSDHEAPQFHERRDFRRRGAKAASS